MTNAEIFKTVDHTLLLATASWQQIQKLCDEAVEYNMASVCVPPAYIGRIRKKYGSRLVICTVLGFPLGYDTTPVKVASAHDAVAQGADELDMVINIGAVKNADFNSIRSEIAQMKEAAGDKILKVIIETCYLTKEEKIELCHCVTEAGADYIKTSTGFGTAGATLDDVLLMKENIGSAVKIKAAGGIRTREDMEAYLQAGCSRLGTSSAIKILAGEQAGAY